MAEAAQTEGTALVDVGQRGVAALAVMGAPVAEALVARAQVARAQATGSLVAGPLAVEAPVVGALIAGAQAVEALIAEALVAAALVAGTLVAGTQAADALVAAAAWAPVPEGPAMEIQVVAGPVALPVARGRGGLEAAIACHRLGGLRARRPLTRIVAATAVAAKGPPEPGVLVGHERSDTRQDPHPVGP